MYTKKCVHLVHLQKCCKYALLFYLGKIGFGTAENELAKAIFSYFMIFEYFNLVFVIPKNRDTKFTWKNPYSQASATFEDVRVTCVREDAAGETPEH